jgi:hypothetical protein
MLTGVEPQWTGVRVNEAIGAIGLDTLASRVEAAGMRAAFASDQPRALELFGVTWQRGLPAAGRATDELFVVNAAVVDRAGHEHGAASAAYRAAALELDRQIVAILDGIDLVRDAVVIVADHGHVAGGGHGGLEPEVVTVPLVLAGAGVRAGATLEPAARMIDVAPTVAALLGVPAPGHGTGSVLVDALVLDPAHRATLVDADARRRTDLTPALSRLATADADRCRSARQLRGGVAAVVLAVLVVGAVRAPRRRWPALGRGVLVGAAAIAAYGLALAVLPLPLAPPHVPGDTRSLLLELSPYAALAGGVLLIAGAIVVRARSLADACGVAAGSLAVTMLPALATWAVIAPRAELLPRPVILMCTPIAAGLAACTAFATWALVIAAMFRAWRR